MKQLYTKESVMRMQSPDYLFFWGHTFAKGGVLSEACLSQMWICGFGDEDGAGSRWYNSAEQYMMAQKALLFRDKDTFEKIMAEYNPVKIKKLGREVKGFDSDLWGKVKYDVILAGNYLKFTQNRALGLYLLDTRDRVLVEASPYDTVYGIGMSADDKDACCPRLWKGENLLGFALMAVRDSVKRLAKYRYWAR